MRPKIPLPFAAAAVFFLCLPNPLVHAETAPSAPDAATNAATGKAVFETHCIACHQKGAKGQVGFAPSIRNRDFLAIASDAFIRRTIREGRPGTAMVGRPDLTDDQISAIIAYLRSAQFANPITINVDPALKLRGDPKSGTEKFATFCAVCHGPFGEGYMAGVPGTGIGLPGFLDVASDDYIRQTLVEGRIGTPMQPFMGRLGLANLSLQDVKDIIAHLRDLGRTYPERAAHQVAGPGNPKVGAVHFSINCAPCHQAGGVGKVGFAPFIRNPDFLAIATDAFIKDTVRQGRPGTAMVARPDLPKQVLNDIIAYLRALPTATKHPVVLDPEKRLRGDPKAGSRKFATFCSHCHGANGEGYAIGVPGTGIGLPGFLNTASDDYIFQTVKRGRVGTPMKPFLGSLGLANLSPPDIYDIISHLRELQSRRVAPSAGETSAFE